MGRKGRKRRGASDGPAPWWFAGIFVLAGLAIWAVGAGWIAVDPDRVHAPGWVIQLVGMVFALGGVMVYASGRASKPVNNALVTLFLGTFAVILSWVAFGPAGRLAAC